LKKILLIAYYFPPMLVSESIRSMRTAKYLPHFDYDPVVLTTNAIEGKADQSLLEQLPPEVLIHRAPFIAGGNMRIQMIYLTTLMRRLFSWQHFDHYKFEWLAPAIALGSRILKEERIVAILSRSTPIASHLVGLMLKLISGLPWIADFSDPWTQNPLFSCKKPIHNFEVTVERFVARLSDKILFTSPYAREMFLRQHKEIHPEKVEVIQNSFDPSDYEGLNREKTSKFTVTYAGSLYGQRSPESFFKALASLRKENVTSEILVRFIGEMGPYEDLPKKLGVDDIVEVHRVLPHKEVISYLFRSDVLLLIDAPSTGPSVFLPMKLVEYLRVGAPILALTPKQGVSADIVQSTKTGVVVHPTEELAIRNALMELYSKYTSGHIPFDPDHIQIENYSAKHCTAKLARILRELS